MVTARTIPLAALDRATHRALVEAGYAPLPEYLARFARPEPSEQPR